MHPKPRATVGVVGVVGVVARGLLVQAEGKRSKDEKGHFLTSSQSPHLFFRDLG